MENSVRTLEAEALILDRLGCDRSPWAAINIHGGKGDRADRLIDVINQLPLAVKSRLTLENDERCYTPEDLLPICKATGVPMVYDIHHHRVSHKLDSYDCPETNKAFASASWTWAEATAHKQEITPKLLASWQLCHISNGRAAPLDRAHADLITSCPAWLAQEAWLDVEAKHKDRAIVQLRRILEIAGEC